MAWLAENEKWYLAGIVDGEGSIGVCKAIRNNRWNPEYRIRMRITNTNKKLFDYIIEILDRQDDYYYLCERLSRDTNRKTIYELEFGDMLTYKFLKEIVDYLLLKTEQAKLAIQMKNTFNGYSDKKIYCGRIVPKDIVDMRENIYKEICKLNQRGCL